MSQNRSTIRRVRVNAPLPADTRDSGLVPLEPGFYEALECPGAVELRGPEPSHRPCCELPSSQFGALLAWHHIVYQSW
ncbi:MAG: hypothetical protein KGL18_13875 [Burkholderiales bacterium]|nr:hypothetical protein [Burkholderiales bacterium]MDE1929463.1 hypothetical protein [Burkholderiales bacterium]MDE2157390.1 hypothetical protein [Burkholderiales bacterium]MDE2504046.1 hypothetical protein [Burkholderiales bacterium]